MARIQSKLTERQADYVEAVLDGQARPPSVSKVVQEALSVARSELSTATQIKRADVLEMLTRAYDAAAMIGEPGNMVSAAREIGKMLGFYEPERIKLELTAGQSNLKSKFEVMSDEELLQIAEGKATVVDGDYVRLS
jgi:hypothetical protein